MTRPPKWRSLALWFDAYAGRAAHTERPDRTAAGADTVQWGRILPFVLLHVACLGALWTGVSWVAVAVAAGLYAIRMFAITGFYHRYFSHRAFRTSRAVQFVFAVVGGAAVQRGPLWWAGHHRRHHKHADTERDAHSPHADSILWSHVGWFTTKANHPTDLDQIRDFAAFPELRFLDRFDKLVPLLLAVALFGLGEWLAAAAPTLGTDGWQMVVWGFCISTVVLFHATSAVNSAGHLFGRRRYDTPDRSRNSWLLALATFGEGWHNNHHFYPVAARQGFFWWEIDLTYYGLRALGALGIVWDLQPVPEHVRHGHRVPQRAGVTDLGARREAS